MARLEGRAGVQLENVLARRLRLELGSHRQRLVALALLEDDNLDAVALEPVGRLAVQALVRRECVGRAAQRRHVHARHVHARPRPRRQWVELELTLAQHHDRSLPRRAAGRHDRHDRPLHLLVSHLDRTTRRGTDFTAGRAATATAAAALAAALASSTLTCSARRRGRRAADALVGAAVPSAARAPLREQLDRPAQKGQLPPARGVVQERPPDGVLEPKAVLEPRVHAKRLHLVGRGRGRRRNGLASPARHRRLVEGSDQHRRHPHRAAGRGRVQQPRTLPWTVLAHANQPRAGLEAAAQRVLVVGEHGAEARVDGLGKPAVGNRRARSPAEAALQLRGRSPLRRELLARAHPAQPRLDRGRRLCTGGGDRGLARARRLRHRREPPARLEGDHVDQAGPAQPEQRLGPVAQHQQPLCVLPPEEATAEALALDGGGAPVGEPRRRADREGLGDLDGIVAEHERVLPLAQHGEALADEALGVAAARLLLQRDAGPLDARQLAHGHPLARLLLEPVHCEHLLLDGGYERALDAVAQEDERLPELVVAVLVKVGTLGDL